VNKKIKLKRIVSILFLFIASFSFGIILNELIYNQNEKDQDQPYAPVASYDEYGVVCNVSQTICGPIYQPFSVLYGSNPDPIIEVTKYVIESAEDLYQLSRLASGSNGAAFLSLHYLLGNDIDYSTVGSGKDFRPLGFKANPNSGGTHANNPLAFQGTFDGQGFEIRNLSLELIPDGTYYDTNFQGYLRYYSMFSVVGENGTVQNLGLINPLLFLLVKFDNMVGASPLVGENYGIVNHVYMRDTKTGTNRGMRIESTLHMSGLMVFNYGSFTDSFVAAERIHNEAILNPTSVSVILKQDYNPASTPRLYYDSTIYLFSAPLIGVGVGLATSAFQTSSNFSSTWFFNNSYGTIATLNNTYPILLGIQKNPANNELWIHKATDLVYMARLIDSPFAFQNGTFRIRADIDMASVARNAYVPPVNTFTGTFRGLNAPTGNRLYTRIAGENQFFSIFNLNIVNGADLGDYAGYGIFGVLAGGSHQDINFIYPVINPSNLSQFSSKSYIGVGLLAGRSTSTITNINIHEAVYTITEPMTNLTYMGGISGLATGTIQNLTTSGDMHLGTYTFDAKTQKSAFGGWVGFAGFPGTTTYLTVQGASTSNRATNSINIIGPGFNNSGALSTTYLGGFVGTGFMTRFQNIQNFGNIQSHPNQSNSFIDRVFIGGMIGFQVRKNNTSSNIRNDGNLSVIVNKNVTASLAGGYGVAKSNLTGSLSVRTVTNVENYGNIQTIIPDGVTLTQTHLEGMNIQVAGIAIGYYFREGRFYQAFNHADFELDLALVQNVAGIMIANNSRLTSATTGEAEDIYNNNAVAPTTDAGANDLQDIENSGNITLTTNYPIYKHQIKVAGVALGRLITFNRIRNTGDISINITENANLSIDSGVPTTDKLNPQQKNIIAVGVAEEISATRRAFDLYNGGTISYTNDSSKDVRFHLYLSGIIHRNNNQTVHVDSSSSSTYNLINDGYVIIDASVTGSTRASGIANVNYGTITNAINAADIYNKNDVKANNYTVDTAGIVNLIVNTSTSATQSRIHNALNYGDLVAYGTNTISTYYGQVVAGGIASRNNITENHLSTTVNTDYYFAEIRHSINYGSVFAWNDRSDCTNEACSVANDPHKLYNSISGGILGNGLLRIDNTLNYGNVYSRTLAGGVVGHLDLHSFAQFSNSSVPATIMANLINYGRVRRMQSTSAFQVDFDNNGITANPAQATTTLVANHNQALGGILGNVYVGSSAWNFAGSNNYEFRTIAKRHWLNFDDQVSILGTSPSVISNPTRAAELSALAYTTKNPDGSPAPYSSVGSYVLDDTSNGVFHSTFPFMQPVSTTPSLENNIQFIPTDRFNPTLMDRMVLDFVPSEDVNGVFALGPISGIGAAGEGGMYLPNNYDFSGLSPYGLTTLSWMNAIVSGGESLSSKVNNGMKQLSKSIAVNIDNVQLIGVGNPSLRINNPEIYLAKTTMEQSTITFYVSNNTTLAEGIGKTSQIHNAYMPARALLAPYGAYESGGVWYGNYSWNGTSYVDVSPAQGTHVLVPVTVFSFTGTTEFIVNTTDSSTYTLGYGASFSYDPDNPLTSTINLPSQILHSYGPFDENGELRDINNNLIYSSTQHIGKIRVFSEAYVHDELNPDANPLTWEDYSIEIVRVQDQQWTSINTLTVNGNSSIPSPLPNFSTNPTIIDLTQGEGIHFRVIGSLGQLIFNVNTLNVPTGHTPHTTQRLIDVDGTTTLSTSFYSFTPATNIVTTITPNGYDESNGTWAAGTMNYTFAVNESLPSTKVNEYYTFEVTIGTDRIYQVRFTKIMSTEARVVAMITAVNTPSINHTTRLMTSDIAYGLYYNPSDTSTRILNFLNLSSISNVYSNTGAITGSDLPTYLNSLTISSGATLVSVSVTREDFDTGVNLRNRYIVTYTIQSEDGLTTNVYNHWITERNASTAVTSATKGLETILTPADKQLFNRLETPVFTYNFSNITTTNFYRATVDGLFVTLDFVGFPGVVAVEGTDYLLSLHSTGYRLEFLSSAPVGEYTVNFSYQRTHIYESPYPLAIPDPHTINWLRNFTTVTFEKVGNIDSRITTVEFTTDALAININTIIHDSSLSIIKMPENITMYEYLYNNPIARVLYFNLSDQIVYRTPETAREYWIIGQVANTDLSYYAPTFIEGALPLGARIYRLTPGGLDEDLYDDFAPIDDDFKYVTYRVFAEGYLESDPIKGEYYTDYHIAVQDTTNNVYFQFDIYKNIDFPIDWIFATLVLIRDSELKQTFSLYSIFDEGIEKGTNYQIRNTMSGIFHVSIILPNGYSYTLKVNNVTQTTNQFEIVASVIPKKYTIRIDIIEAVESVPWGQQTIHVYQAN